MLLCYSNRWNAITPGTAEENRYALPLIRVLSEHIKSVIPIGNRGMQLNSLPKQQQRFSPIRFIILPLSSTELSGSELNNEMHTSHLSSASRSLAQRSQAVQYLILLNRCNLEAYIYCSQHHVAVQGWEGWKSLRQVTLALSLSKVICLKKQSEFFYFYFFSFQEKSWDSQELMGAQNFWESPYLVWGRTINLTLDFPTSLWAFTGKST